MRRNRLWQGAFLTFCAATLAPYGSARSEQQSFAAVERGRYLTAAGDCQSCHTVENGEPFAGGRPIQTPFGIIYSANITPDHDTGVGSWSADQFYRALHEGIAADGDHLYPAFPYPWYTKVTREDADDIWAYLGTLTAVKNKKPDNKLDWPLNYRMVMGGWNELFFTAGTFKPNANKPPEWNRGAYLVEGLAHCGACHTPTNMFGAAKPNDHLQGGTLQNWYAADLTGDLESGLGNWSADDIVQFLKTGRNIKTAAYGPMSEVIQNSTSKLNDADLEAIAAYLKDVPAPAPDNKPANPDPKVAQAGEAIYVDNCSACHRSNGEGSPGTFPALKSDATAQDRDPTTIIRVILDGTRAVATDARPTPLSMPSFKWKLSNEQVAAVASYFRSAWGNTAPAVSASDVQSIRQVVGANSR